MTGSDYLHRLRTLAADIASLNTEINNLYGVRAAAGLNASAVKTNKGMVDQTSETAIKAATLSATQNQILSNYLDIYEKVFEVREQMQDRLQYAVLSSRYILGKSWEVIAKELNYSVQQIFRVHKLALAEFNRLWGLKYDDK